MSIGFVARKCACGGKLEYSPLKKVWECKYCGTIVEREATFNRVQIDGLEGINDIVRQALLEIASGELEDAQKCLDDCDRKGHQHIGTLIAYCSYYLEKMKYIRSQNEGRELLEKLKFNLTRFNREYPVITEDEINLYESFGDSSADIFGNLLFLYSSIKDKKREEFILSKLNVDEIFSKKVNSRVAEVFIKENRLEQVKKIVFNKNNIDAKEILKSVLNFFPDNPQKVEFLQELWSNHQITGIESKFFEEYLEKSSDSISTKSYIIEKLVENNINFNIPAIIKSACENISDYTTAKELFIRLYIRKIRDKDTEEIFKALLKDKKYIECVKGLIDSLKEKSIFYVVPSRVIIEFLSLSNYSFEDKGDIVIEIFSLNSDEATINSVYNQYLTENKDEKENRYTIINKLLNFNNKLHLNTINNYIINSSIDEENKIIIAKKIFEGELNKAYLKDILSNYLILSKDTAKIREQMIKFLLNEGFTIDDESFNKYLADKKIESKEKIEILNALGDKKVEIDESTLDNYILLSEKDRFSIELFNILLTKKNRIGVQAFVKYLFEISDSNKIANIKRLINSLYGDLKHYNISIKYDGDSINCNCLQGYLLLSSDSQSVCQEMCAILSDYGVKLADEIICNSERMKFKKYINNNLKNLPKYKVDICDKYRLFSFF